MTTTVRSHLVKMHTDAAEYHTHLAKCHAGMAKCFSKLAASDDDNKDVFGELASHHQEMSDAHIGAAESAVERAKGLSSASKAAGGDEIVPDRVSMIYKNDYNPNLRAIPRTGAPQVSRELVDVSMVDPALQKFATVDDSID